MDGRSRGPVLKHGPNTACGGNAPKTDVALPAYQHLLGQEMCGTTTMLQSRKKNEWRCIVLLRRICVWPLFAAVCGVSAERSLAAEPTAARKILDDFYQQHPPQPSEPILRQQEKAVQDWARSQSSKLASQVGGSIGELLRTAEEPAKSPPPAGVSRPKGTVPFSPPTNATRKRVPPSVPAAKIATVPVNGYLTPQQVESLSKSVADATRKLLESAADQRGTVPFLPPPAAKLGTVPNESSRVANSGNPDVAPPAKSSQPLRGTPDTLGPLKFLVPDGWIVQRRDPTSLLLQPREPKPGYTYIAIARHPGGAMHPYTPEGISQYVIDGITEGGVRDTPHTSQTIAVGVEKRSAVWLGSSVGGQTMQHVFVACSGGVYMISTNYDPNDHNTPRDYEHLLQSLRFGDSTAKLPEAGPREPTAAPSSAGSGSATSPTANGVVRRPSKEEIEAVAQKVSEQFPAFLRNRSQAESNSGPGLALREDMQALENAARRGQYVMQQCTWGVGEIIEREHLPYPSLPSVRAARLWFNGKFPQGQTPQKGAIMVLNAWKGNPEGHVGVVQSVHTEGGNVVSFTVEHWNWDEKGGHFTTAFEFSGHNYGSSEDQAIHVVGGTRDLPLRGFIYPPQ